MYSLNTQTGHLGCFPPSSRKDGILMGLINLPAFSFFAKEVGKGVRIRASVNSKICEKEECLVSVASCEALYPIAIASMEVALLRRCDSSRSTPPKFICCRM